MTAKETDDCLVEACRVTQAAQAAQVTQVTENWLMRAKSPKIG